MARLVEIISTKTAMHYILIGYDTDQTSSFKLMMWITKYGQHMVDFVQHMGLNFISFIGGELWIHNDDSTNRCNLFGEKRDCIVGVVTNEQPMRVKLLDSMGVYSDSPWEVTQIVIPPTLNYPNGMESKIPIAQFKKRGGIWRARFLRNMKTTSGTVSVLDAVQGEPLTGQEAYILLKNTSNDQVKLFQVEVAMTPNRVQ
jgi:hypothetical protein